mgnify:CR=1 FL=1
MKSRPKKYTWWQIVIFVIQGILNKAVDYIDNIKSKCPGSWYCDYCNKWHSIRVIKYNIKGNFLYRIDMHAHYIKRKMVKNMNNLTFDKLEEEMIKRCVDYMHNTAPYNVEVAESSGFRSGVMWALKKLKKLDYLNIDKSTAVEAIPNGGTDPYYHCPVCGEFELEPECENYCPKCGQKLKYS